MYIAYLGDIPILVCAVSYVVIKRQILQTHAVFLRVVLANRATRILRCMPVATSHFMPRRVYTSNIERTGHDQL